MSEMENPLAVQWDGQACKQAVCLPNDEDEALIAKVKKSKQGAAFSRLWDGDISEFNEDAELADIALCGMLAFWTQRDKERMDRLYEDGQIEKITERYRVLFKELSANDTTEKQAMAAAAILIADELACDWIFGGKTKPLTTAEIESFLATKASVSAGSRCYEYLCDYVTKNANKMRPPVDGIYAGDVLGLVENNKAYIIRSVFDSALSDAGYSTAAMMSYLKQAHLVETRGRANTKPKRINGILTECVCLKLPSFDEEISDNDRLPL